MLALGGAAMPAGKWMGLVAAIWVQAFAGNAYTFAHYSHALKATLHYNQLRLNNLGVAKDFGENVGLLAGLICNRLSPWAVLCIGAFNGLFGYGLLWLVASQRIQPLPYWQMCAAICIGANSSTWFNTAVLVTCMRNFPHSRGTVAGFLKGFVGLSAAIFTEFFTAFLFKDPVKLLLFLAVAPAAVCLIAMMFIRPVKPSGDFKSDHEEHGNFFFIYMVCLGLALYLLISTVLEDLIPITDPFATKIIAVVMLLLLLAPVYVPAKILLDGLLERNEESRFDEISIDPIKAPLIVAEHTQSSVSERKVERAENMGVKGTASGLDTVTDVKYSSANQLLRVGMSKTSEIDENDAETLLAVAEGAVQRKKGPRRGDDFKLRQALVKADFWLLFLTFFCGVGSGVTAINNLGQIGEAQGYQDVTIFVSLVSVWNFLGRLGGGSLSEHFVRLAAIPRPVWMGASQALMIIAHLLFASALPGSLHAASAILGICYGVQFSVMVPTASELFGLKHFGLIYNFLTMADPVGSLLFSGILAGSLFDKEAEVESGNDHYYGMSLRGGNILTRAVDTQCVGAHCFRLTFLIMAGVCVVGVILCVILSLRIKPVYKGLYGGSRSSNILPSLPQDAPCMNDGSLH
eukprot:c25645_g1_i1 orf=745-2640(-)